MPIDFSWETPCVVATFRGEVTREDIIDAYRRIEGDPRFDQLRRSIIDLRDLTPAPVDDTLLEEMAAENWAASAHNQRLTTAVVAVDPAIVAAIRRYQALLPRPRFIPEVIVCATVEEAHRSLDALAKRKDPESA